VSEEEAPTSFAFALSDIAATQLMNNYCTSNIEYLIPSDHIIVLD